MIPRRLSLADPPFENRTGAGVTVAVIDSGVHPDHPHVGRVSESAWLGDADSHADTIDRLGHGTAVAAAIREKAPAAELKVGKVFDRVLKTNAAALARGVDWAVEKGARIANLSLGTANTAHADLLRASVATARSRGVIVVAARESNGQLWLPGSLELVASVVGDAGYERDELGVESGGNGGNGAVCFRASPYPRPIPGVPQERNYSGVSFAVANVTGFLARLLEGRPEVRNIDDVVRALDLT